MALKNFGRYQKLSLAWLIIGLGLFAYLVYRTHAGTIVDKVELFGANFLILLLISGARQVMRTFAWRYCIEREYRQVSLFELFKMRLAADAITDLTIAGPVLGETAKTFAAREHMPLAFSLSSIFLENLIYSLAVVVFIISGAFVLLGRFAVPHRMQVAALAGILVLVLLVAVSYLLISRRRLIVSGFLDWLKRRNILWGIIGRHEERLKLLESNVYDFYGKHRRMFWVILLLEVGANLTGVIEAYVILGVAFGVYAWSFAYLVEWSNRVVNSVFAFIPLRAGVDEGSTALTLDVLGYTASAGVSLAIIRKVRTLFWIAVGLLMTAQYSLSPRATSGEVGNGEDRAK
jgi:hypothetical protein